MIPNNRTSQRADHATGHAPDQHLPLSGLASYLDTLSSTEGLSLYLVHPQKISYFLEELSYRKLTPLWQGAPGQALGQLFLCTTIVSPIPMLWAQECYEIVSIHRAPSIKTLAEKLNVKQSYYFFPWQLHRRTELIKEQLPKKRLMEKRRLLPLPSSKGEFIAAFRTLLLLAPDTLLELQGRTSAPEGVFEFDEDKSGPPSRAYLKMWEALHRLGQTQVIQDTKPLALPLALDLGASPGGWTWALQRQGYEVISIDRSPLAPNVAKLSHVTFRRGDAFNPQLPPDLVARCSLVVSDVAAYPERVFELIEQWYPRPMILTLKLQGPTPWQLLERFRQWPKGILVHLYHNKHELTWLFPGLGEDKDQVK